MSTRRQRAGRNIRLRDEHDEFQVAASGRVAKVGSAKTLVVTSWEVILGAVAVALDAAQDHNALADIRQLQGLAERMDAEAFLPLTAEDITGPTPRRLLQLCEVVNQAWTLLARESFVSSKGMRVSSGAGWYGPYLLIHGFGCQLIFSAGSHRTGYWRSAPRARDPRSRASPSSNAVRCRQFRKLERSVAESIRAPPSARMGHDRRPRRDAVERSTEKRYLSPHRFDWLAPPS